MKPYNRNFESSDDAEAYFKSIGKLKLFGVQDDYYVYHFYHKDGRMYHMNLYKNGNVEYEEMSITQYQYWRSKE